MQTSYPTATSNRIQEIENNIFHCLDTDSPIDPKLLKELSELRLKRLDELLAKQKKNVADRESRFAVMQQKTRELRDKLVFTPEMMSLHAGSLDKLYAELDQYDEATILWVNKETCLWEESKVSNIVAGILILADEIR